ncbi:MAG: ATP-dependent Clp protease ATP-binding subunit [Candidatus Niyogibacteria bacterium]|nr:ATP-dependent Clp protease ATP-binding subunit [Candidatus Niyogibacteria bacterium]
MNDRKRRILNASPDGKNVKKYKATLDRYIVSQERAKKKILEILLRKDAGVSASDKPLGIIALFGPSGVGKTELVKTLARIWFDDPLALTLIEGQNFKERHELSALLGSPPGYIGFDDASGDPAKRSPALLSQAKIDQPGKRAFAAKVSKLEQEVAKLEALPINKGNALKDAFVRSEADALRQEIAEIKSCLRDGMLSIVLFDEAEKMHPDVLQVLLSILNEGRAVLKNGEVTDFTRTVICLTGNVAHKELSKMACDTQLGFHASNSGKGKRDKNKEAFKVVTSALKKAFGAPLLGRIGDKNIIVCQPLTYDEMVNILDARAIRELLEKLAKHPKKFTLVIDEAAKKRIANECFRNPDLGARALSNLVEEWILRPLTFILAKAEDEGGIAVGSKVFVVLEESTQKIIFECEE